MPTGYRFVQTVAGLRLALRQPSIGAQVRIYLAERTLFRLGGALLPVHHYNVAIIGGDGATIDAEGLSRHFDVALGGKLHLDNVHLTGGGFEMTGGSVLVRLGAELTTNNVTITDSRAFSNAATVCMQPLMNSRINAQLIRHARLAARWGDRCG